MNVHPSTPITNAEDILNFDDLPTGEITVAEWGNRTLTIRALDTSQVRHVQHVMAEIYDFENERPTNMKAFGKLQVQIAAWGIIHPETHQLLFTRKQSEGLLQKNPKAIEFVSSEINRLSRMNEGAAAETEKNSE